VFAEFSLKKSEKLTYTYTMTTNFADVADYARGLVLNSYQSLFQGNRYLKNGLYQNHSLKYFKYNMFNFTQIYGAVTYSKMVDAVKSLSAFNGVNQLGTVENSPFADESVSAYGGYNRSFARFYKASFNASVSWNRFNNFRANAINGEATITNSVRQVSEQVSQSYTASLGTNFKTLPNLELGYSYTLNDYTSNKFYNHSPFAKFDYYFLDAFTITASYEYTHYYNDTRTSDNEYDFLNADIMYRVKDSHWEFKVGGTNLLNTTSLNNDSFNQLSTSTSRYRVQPRYLLLTIKYNL